ncbi:MSF1-domain-containing protein [Backusella circina FSU 941]|nr:MSF1-domain-containing protein [Backusella circina FSU 941]
MVKIYQHSYIYDHDWETVTMASWMKYPNPMAPHIQSVDMLECSVDKEGVLRTKRLIVKTGVLPSWFPKRIVNSNSACIIEETMVNPHTKVMITSSVNLNHTKILTVEECQTIKEVDNKRTVIISESRIHSGFGFGMAGKIESFGESTVVSHTLKAREGLRDLLLKGIATT